MKKYKVVIFDMDGTIVNSIEGLGTSMNEVLKKHNYPVHNIEKYYYFVGNGMKKLAERALPAEAIETEGIDKYYKELVTEYAKYYQVGMHLYDGISELLDELSARGYKLAINSNKIDDMVKKITDKYFGRWIWQATLGARENIPIKPNPAAVNEIMELTGVSKAEILYVGDSEVDIQTGINAGVDVAFVSWGFRSKEDVKGMKINYEIDEPKQLLEILD